MKVTVAVKKRDGQERIYCGEETDLKILPFGQLVIYELLKDGSKRKLAAFSHKGWTSVRRYEGTPYHTTS